jgi:hypothetical protein
MNDISIENLVTKICEAIKTLGAIPKTGRNDFHKYSYRKHEDIMTVLQPALSTRGLLMFSKIKTLLSNTVEGKEGKSRHIVISVVYTITDGKNSIDFMGIGEGIDTGDKASYKAQTGAMKYALNDMFLLASEADPERDTKETPVNSPSTKTELSDSDKSQIVDMASEMGWDSKRIDIALERAEVVGSKKALDGMTAKYKDFLAAQAAEK